MLIIMDSGDFKKSEEELSRSEFEVNKLTEPPPRTHGALNINPKDRVDSNDENALNNLHHKQEVLENSEKQDFNVHKLMCCTKSAPNSDAEGSLNFHEVQNNQTCPKDSLILSMSVLHKTKNSLSCVEKKSQESPPSNLQSEAVVKVMKPLCADYKSDSEVESTDSESDSSTNSYTDISSKDECSSDSDINDKEVKFEEKKLKKELSFSDLPPIEDLSISVPEDVCVEIGTVTSIVETLVVIESYKGTAALDLDTVLFLDCGKKTLGKVFEILGPVTEPVYTVRFNSQEQIKNLKIEKNLKVYYAPKTEYTTFVFMSEILKNRGSDASWKDNTEAPPEFQDFSDDEQERIYKNKNVRETDEGHLSLKEQNKSKKRPHKVKPSPGVFQTSGFRNPNFSFQRRPSGPKKPSVDHSAPSFFRPSAESSSDFNPIRTPLFPYNYSLHSFPSSVAVPPRVCFSSRFSSPPLPVLGLPHFSQNRSFQHSFYQQHTFESWGRSTRPMYRYQVPLPPPPPPPPPPAEQDTGLFKRRRVGQG